MLGHVRREYTGLGHFRPGYDILCQVKKVYATLGHVIC
jgi:hypothetical protein